MKMPSASSAIKLTRTPRTAMKLSRPKTNKPEKPRTEMGLIHGRKPESSYEWNIAVALEQYGWKFYYQLQVRGGSEVRGGQILDFLVMTRPFYTALAVDAGYWHRNSQAEQLKDSQMIRGLRAMNYLVNNEVLHAIDENAATPDDAASFVYKNFGRS